LSWIRVVEPQTLPLGERPVYLVRKDFELASVPQSATLEISAHGIYTAYLNGIRVGDVELTPGFTQYEHRTQLQSYDVTSLLLTGENSLVVELADGWYRGSVSIFQVGDQFGDSVELWANLISDGALVLETDESWLSTPSHILAADLMRGQVEDRNRYNQANYLPGLDTSTWSQVSRAAYSGELVPELAEPMRVVERIAPIESWVLDSGEQVIDFGQNVNGWVRLSYLGPKDSKLTLTHAEHLDSNRDVTLTHLDCRFPDMPVIECHQIDQVISAGIEGDFFEPRFTTHGFQYLKISGLDRPISHTEIDAAFVHTDMVPLSEFHSSDERLNWLHQAAVRSFRGNACDIPTDCPTRERSGWTGDWQIYAQTAAMQFDVSRFSSKFMTDVRLNQEPDGKIRNIAPLEPGGKTGFPAKTNGSAGWGDAIVHVPYVLFQEYGDITELEVNFDAMVAWVDYAAKSAASGRHPSRSEQPRKEHEEYLWDTGFHWGEWLEPGVGGPDPVEMFTGDKAVVATAYLHRSATQLAAIAKLLRKPADDVQRYEEIARRSRLAWQQEFLNDDGTITRPTQGNYVRALAFELVPEESKAATAKELVRIIKENGNRLGTGFLATALLLPTLAEAGYPDVACDLLFQEQEPSWLCMRNRGATTIWEQWHGVDSEGVAHESLNHYSKGAVASFLYRYIAGLKPTAPGYIEYEVAPLLNPEIESVGYSLQTPQGLLRVSWKLTRSQFQVAVDASEMSGTGVLKLPNSAVIVIPSHSMVTESAGF
jgi:alpha-L-rhamnosidase